MVFLFQEDNRLKADNGILVFQLPRESYILISRNKILHRWAPKYILSCQKNSTEQINPWAVDCSNLFNTSLCT